MNIKNFQSQSLAKALAILIVSACLGLLFDYLFFDRFPGVSFPIYIAVTSLGLFAIARFLGKPIDRGVYWIFLPIAFFSAMVFVRASLFLTFLNIVASFALLLVVAEVSFRRKLKDFFVIEYVKLLFLPFMFIGPLVRTLSDILLLRGVGKDRQVLSQVIKGIVFAIPVLAIFLLLFSSADLVFHKYVTEIISLDIQERTVVRLVLVAIATLVYIGAYSYIFRENVSTASPTQNSKEYSIGQIEAGILFGSVNLLFLVFIGLQLAYLFGGEATISQQGFTYAEYARRGFFELIAVAIISFLLLLITEKYIAKRADDHATLFKVLSALLTVQVMLIIASAFMRLWLYEQAYGFTTMRFYSHGFTILLVGIFCLLLYKIFIDKKENTFAFRVFILILLFLGAINILNPDRFIAQQNLERYVTTKKLDVEYLARLSDDAIAETIKILTLPEESLRAGFAQEFVRFDEFRNTPALAGWQSFNLSRDRANKILQSRASELERYQGQPEELLKEAPPTDS